MRVIAGKARRLNLKTIEGKDTRPTTDRVKETLFNMINNDLEGTNFLDLFAGSGAIGIEALSRGAKKCTFVENNPKATNCIKDNLEFTKLSTQAKVLKKDVLSSIGDLGINNEVFDIIFMDPPYNKGLEREALKEIIKAGIINKDSLIIVEAEVKDNLDDITDLGFLITREKIYKTNKHVFICLNQEEL